MPMNFIKENQLIASVFGPKRTAQIPKFKIWKLDSEVVGDQTVATPPPHRYKNESHDFKRVNKHIEY